MHLFIAYHCLLQDTMGNGSIVDGVIAQDATQAKAIWQLRETIAEALKKAGAVYKCCCCVFDVLFWTMCPGCRYDVSIPVPVLYDLVEDMRLRLEGEVGTSSCKHHR